MARGDASSFADRGEPQLDEVTLDRAVAVLGQPASVNALFSKLTAGEPISLGVFGASMAQNGGCLNQFGKRCMQFSGLLGYRKGFAVRPPGKCADCPTRDNHLATWISRASHTLREISEILSIYCQIF